MVTHAAGCVACSSMWQRLHLLQANVAHYCLKEAANIATCCYGQHSQQRVAIEEAEQTLGECRGLSDLMWAMSLMR